MPGGRKPKLTEEMTKMLCGLKQQGLTNRAACDGVGICETTFYDYYSKGETGLEQGKTNIYTEFVKAYKKAESAHKLKRIQQIQQAASDGNWQAAAWELERCYPKEYGRRTVSELSGKDGEPIRIAGDLKTANIDLSALTDEDIRRLDEAVSKIVPA